MDTKKLITKWREMCAHMGEIDTKVLQLMRHPDTTAEQLAQVHTMYVNMWKKHTETKRALREKFPERTYVRFPWNK